MGVKSAVQKLTHSITMTLINLNSLRFEELMETEKNQLARQQAGMNE